jgi:hypothetical protein
MKTQEIKEFDVLHVQRKAAIKTAKVLKVEYCDFMDYPELQKSIKEKDEDLYNLMMEFSSAYWKYYYFSNSLNEQSKGIKIDPHNSAILKEHIREKDETRMAWVIEIKKRKKVG